MTSTDGANWVDGSISDHNWESIEWNDLGIFVAVATNGYLAYSTDGFNWIENVLSGNLRGVSWSNELSLFLVVGNDIVYTSSFKNRQPTNHNIFDSEFNSINENGEWTFKSLTATTITSTNLIYGEDIDVEDKITSIETTIASHTDDIALNTANILTKQDLITSSTDGANWVDGSISDYNWESIEWSDLGMFVAVATNGYISYSTDGFNWNQIRITTTGDLRTITWSNKLSLFVIIGNDILYTSSLKSREPTNDNIFDSEFNSINENGEWTFKSLTATTITGNNLIYGEDLIDVDDKITSIETALTELDELTASHITQISSNDTDITALQGRLDTEEPKTSALQTLTATHSTDIASNTTNILTKQDTITTSTYLNCNSLTTNHLEVDNILSTSQFWIQL